MKDKSDTLLFVVDLMGTFVFAVEGAMAAVRGNLDLLGLLVLSFATALGGGIIRDVLIGDVPPASIRDWRYGVTAFAGGAVAFFLYRFDHYIPPQVLVLLDAGGLSLFAVTGASKALAAEIQPLIAVLLGGITGVGGGTVRDVLLAQVPAVLRIDVYATAALAGAAVVVIGIKMGGNRTLMAVLGAIVCFLLRMLAFWLHWNLPKAAAP
jgi:uncharacterized membrane protein YeiH